MSNRYQIRQQYNPRIGKFSWIIKCNNRGSSSSLALCQRTTNVQTNCLFKENNYKNKITLSQKFIPEISWWIQQLEIWNGKEIITGKPDFEIETDASTMGRGFHCLFPQVKMVGPWSLIKKKNYT